MAQYPPSYDAYAQQPAQPAPPAKRSRRGLIIGLAAGAVVLCALCALVCGGLTVLGAVNGSTPTKTATAYFDALKEGSCSKVLDTVVKESNTPGGAETLRALVRQDCEKQIAANGKLTSATNLIESEKKGDAQNDTAVVTAKLTWANGQQQSRQVHVIKHSDGWKVFLII